MRDLFLRGRRDICVDNYWYKDRSMFSVLVKYGGVVFSLILGSYGKFFRGVDN